MGIKSTGIVRRIDDLGRVVIPREIRERLKIVEGEPLEIFVADGGVFLKIYNDKTFTDDEVEFLDEVKSLLKIIYKEKDIDKLFNKIL